MDKQQVMGLKPGDKVKFVKYYHGVSTGTVARIPDNFKPPRESILIAEGASRCEPIPY